MIDWIPLHVHSAYSILDGLSQPKKIVETCVNRGYNSCALTDHGSMSGTLDFIKHCQKAQIKPILGNEFYISQHSASKKTQDNRSHSHLVVLSKNKDGWNDLIKATSLSNSKENFYYKPRLSLEEISPFSNNWQILTGHPGTQIANSLFYDYKLAYNSLTASNSESYINEQSILECKKEIEKHQKLFPNLAIEIQLFDKEHFPVQIVLAKYLRQLAKECGVRTVATPDAHYCNQEDAEDQRILLCGALKTTLQKAANNPETPLYGFFKSDKYYIPTIEEINELYEEEEIQAAKTIASEVDEFDVFSEPKLPIFPSCSSRKEEAELLKEKCREGWTKKIDKYLETPTGYMEGKTKKELQKVYKERVLEELEVFENAELCGYFLIVQEYINWAKKNDVIVGNARGSSAGCLVSFLTGITHTVEPLTYDLLFSRFYNKARKGSLPDIDTDFEKRGRDDVVQHLKDLYGDDKVSQIVTFGELKGAGALKEVLRAHQACDNDTMNTMTKPIPTKERVIDKMEDFGEESLLMYVLKYDPELVSDFCQWDEKKGFTGPYAQYFEQAVRLEGCYKSTGKHACGVIISSETLSNICPMIYDKKEKQEIIGFDMKNSEKIGLVKFDILGLRYLDKLSNVNEFLV